MKSDQNQVTLKNMNLDSAGQFRCEISAEAPLFNTVSQSRPLSVIGLYFGMLLFLYVYLNIIVIDLDFFLYKFVYLLFHSSPEKRATDFRREENVLYGRSCSCELYVSSFKTSSCIALVRQQ